MTPKVAPLRRRALKAVEALFTPLLPDDYLELINPLWSTRELRGRIERIEPETANAVTVTIRPGHEWQGHLPGQYLRVGIVVDGRHHWRAYSLTSDPERSDGWITITPKRYEPGVVSPYLTRQARPGEIVRLGGVEGTFTLPDPLPRSMLFVSAGSGITPVMSMLRNIERRGALHDVLLVHSARTRDDFIFGDRLRSMAERNAGFRLVERHTAEQGRMSVDDIDALCPDWRERETFVCGPREMIDALCERWQAEGLADRLRMERFQPIIGGEVEPGLGGTIRFLRSGKETACDGSTPILVAGEAAGIEMPFGCRMGICHTCTGRLCSGELRDLRTGEIHGVDGEMVRTCVNAPEGPVEIAL
ncbi:MAG TPA: ferredoxin reductase [Thermoleophilaceae bacterium]|nr:ferredoxin reductase [Thermoleophilaceae bacterium]